LGIAGSKQASEHRAFDPFCRSLGQGGDLQENAQIRNFAPPYPLAGPAAAARTAGGSLRAIHERPAFTCTMRWQWVVAIKP
jgi:hypothetical protein